jgi:arginine decarboxylase-like protein
MRLDTRNRSQATHDAKENLAGIYPFDFKLFRSQPRNWAHDLN